MADPALIAVGVILLLIWLATATVHGRWTFRLRADQHETLTFVFLPAKLVMSIAAILCALVQGIVGGQWWFQSLSSPAVEIAAAVIVRGCLRPLWFYAACHLMFTNLSSLIDGHSKEEHPESSSCCSRSDTAVKVQVPTESLPPLPAPGSRQIDAPDRMPRSKTTVKRLDDDGETEFFDRASRPNGDDDEATTCVEPFSGNHRDPCSPVRPPWDDRWFLRARRRFVLGFWPWALMVAVWTVIHIALAIAESDSRARMRDLVWCAEPPSRFNGNVVSCRAVISSSTHRFLLPKSFEILELLFLLSCMALWGWLGGRHSRLILQPSTQSRFYHLFGAVMGLLVAEAIVRSVALCSFARSGWPNALVAMVGSLLDMGLYSTLLSRIVGLTDSRRKASRTLSPTQP